MKLHRIALSRPLRHNGQVHAHIFVREPSAGEALRIAAPLLIDPADRSQEAALARLNAEAHLARGMISDAAGKPLAVNLDELALPDFLIVRRELLRMLDNAKPQTTN